MNHPYLYIHFEPLRALVAEDQLLFKILNILNVIFDDLPDDPELSIYYVLGACAAHHHELQHILQHANVSDYTSSPEQADKLAADFSTKLQYQCLKTRLNPRNLTVLQK